ncbi:hypothetical protein [Actinocorallia longicatena]|uniref:DUF4333 domain-containing protein n=1 Tax=Actinocorallia longicatena TaxID=111803 RepID=A0ABP6Q2J4_9ACTN
MVRRLAPALAALLLLTACTACAEEKAVAERVSEGSLKIAMSNGSAAELKALGYRVRGGIGCRTLAGNTLAHVRVECSGTTSDGQPIRVEGTATEADTTHPEQDFVITVGGREVLHKDCLATGCKDK